MCALLTVVVLLSCVDALRCAQEEQLFHNLSAVLQRMRVAASVTEARDLALQLRRMCAAVRASLETHVRYAGRRFWVVQSRFCGGHRGGQAPTRHGRVCVDIGRVWWDARPPARVLSQGS